MPYMTTSSGCKHVWHCVLQYDHDYVTLSLKVNQESQDWDPLVFDCAPEGVNAKIEHACCQQITGMVNTSVCAWNSRDNYMLQVDQISASVLPAGQQVWHRVRVHRHGAALPGA